MAQIKVRNLDEWIVSVLRDNALHKGQSLEEHLRQLLHDAALADQMQFAKEQAVHLKEFQERYGRLTDSTEGIREDRDLHG